MYFDSAAYLVFFAAEQLYYDIVTYSVYNSVLIWTYQKWSD